MGTGGVFHEDQRAKARVSVFQEFANQIAARAKSRSGRPSGGQDNKLLQNGEPRRLFLLLKAAQEAVRLPWSTFSTPSKFRIQAKEEKSSITERKGARSARDMESIAVRVIHGCGICRWFV
jgi:hypothetical protein